MRPSEPVNALAPAKVNLALEVLGPRGDGYHELVTVIQTVEFGDVVSIQESVSGDALMLAGPYAASTPGGPTNLVHRAVAAVRSRFGALPPLEVGIAKHIPPAGGLGGGASDAAAVLRLLFERFDVPCAIVEEAAAAIGSDEPALLLGGTVLAEGRGERVSRLADLAPHDVVLFPVAASIDGKTGHMFAALAEQKQWSDGSRTRQLVDRIVSGGTIAAADVVNDFESVAFQAFGGLGDLRDRIGERCGVRARLAGAGPSLYWIGAAGEGRVIADRAIAAGIEAIATRTARGTGA
jgi:4-diphosphocytidyl-2-C-methyl-D-erythritol kinase